MRFQRPLILSLAISVVPLAGCGEGKPQLAKVHGKVTYKGKPVPSGNVLFVPAVASKDGRDFPASGLIKGEDGAYELTTFEPGDGAAVGQHKVAVISLDGGSKVEAPSEGYNSQPVRAGKQAGPRPGAMKSLVPTKYASPDTSPLTKTVAPGDNTLDIEIVD